MWTTFGGSCQGTLVLADGYKVGGNYVAKELRGLADERDLADGVGVDEVDDFSTYFYPDPGLMQPAFDPAFVEHVWMMGSDKDESVRSAVGKGQHLVTWDAPIPFFDNLFDDVFRDWFQRKWMRGPSRAGLRRIAQDNTHVVLTGSHHHTRDGRGWNWGVTEVANGFNDTWLFIEQSGEGKALRESTVHDLTHQWRVNEHFLPWVLHDPAAYTMGHCNTAFGGAQKMAGDKEKDCTMTSDIYYSSSQGSDGIVGFHFVTLPDGKVDSEYTFIRERADPIPQNEVTGRPLP